MWVKTSNDLVSPLFGTSAFTRVFLIHVSIGGLIKVVDLERQSSQFSLREKNFREMVGWCNELLSSRGGRIDNLFVP